MPHVLSKLSISAYSDDVNSGNYRIRVVVDKQGTVGQHRVSLYEINSRRLIRVGFGDKDTGEILFNYIAYRYQGYFLIADDRFSQSPMNAAIADLVTPEPMP